MVTEVPGHLLMSGPKVKLKLLQVKNSSMTLLSPHLPLFRPIKTPSFTKLQAAPAKLGLLITAKYDAPFPPPVSVVLAAYNLPFGPSFKLLKPVEELYTTYMEASMAA